VRPVYEAGDRQLFCEDNEHEMGTRIVIKVGDRNVPGELNDSKAAADLAAALPQVIRMSRWGEEYYGSIPLDIAQDNSARELMEEGEVAYWPPGRALCVFFGPTPASTDDRPRAASPVVPLGRVTAGIEILKQLGSSIEARVEVE
jgi:hypothetical protein